jgi:import inner membrane translocase subunit TIM21
VHSSSLSSSSSSHISEAVAIVAASCRNGEVVNCGKLRIGSINDARTFLSSSSSSSPSFRYSHRGYASSSGSGNSGNNNKNSEKNSGKSSKALTIEDDEEFDEITDKWIPEKPVTKAETAGYSVVIILGLGLAASALFFASKELFMSPKEYVAFNAALKQIELDPRVTSALGESITGYGSESRNRSQRQRIPHTIVRDPASGREVVRVQFHARGARGNATVHAEYDPSNAEEPFGYLIVDVERPRAMRLVVKEPRQRRSIMGPGTSLVG